MPPSQIVFNSVHPQLHIAVYHVLLLCMRVQVMGKSIRSKRRQRVLAVRREKYREVERKKCWEHHLRRQREKVEEMDGVVLS